MIEREKTRQNKQEKEPEKKQEKKQLKKQLKKQVKKQEKKQLKKQLKKQVKKLEKEQERKKRKLIHKSAAKPRPTTKIKEKFSKDFVTVNDIEIKGILTKTDKKRMSDFTDDEKNLYFLAKSITKLLNVKYKKSQNFQNLLKKFQYKKKPITMMLNDSPNLLKILFNYVY
jgi:hypothetical protein